MEESSIPIGSSYKWKGPWAVLRMGYQPLPSLADIFGSEANPQDVVVYPRYEHEPEITCVQCGARVKLSRVPFQNGCLQCPDMGLKILVHVLIFVS